MSINPAPAVGPLIEAPTDAVQPRVRQSTSDSPIEPVRIATRPGLGTPPKQENSTANTAPEPAEFPEDEVQLQQDSEIKGQVVVRYLDKVSGQVVLQVPSEQVLAVDRGIYDEFRKQAAPVGGEGEKPNGH